MTDPMTPERLAEIEARLTAPRLGRSMWRETDLDLLAIRDLAAEVRRLQAAVERVRELHYETTWCDTDKAHGCKTCADMESVCDADSEYWPCPTIAALDGDEQ